MCRSTICAKQTIVSLKRFEIVMAGDHAFRLTHTVCLCVQNHIVVLHNLHMEHFYGVASAYFELLWMNERKKMLAHTHIKALT